MFLLAYVGKKGELVHTRSSTEMQNWFRKFDQTSLYCGFSEQRLFSRPLFMTGSHEHDHKSSRIKGFGCSCCWCSH